jgi:alpha-glucosidase
MSRWGGANPSPALAKTLNRMLMSLRGSVCSYQGEELGLTEAVIEQNELQDPYGITFWPRFKGRDGCRTPMPWVANAKNAGFSNAKTWLPVSPEHLASAIDVQEINKKSVLNAYRQFMQWRKQQPALLWGDIEFLDAPENVLLFVRYHNQQKIIAGFNFSSEPVQVSIVDAEKCKLLDAELQLLNIDNNGENSLTGSQLLLEPYGNAFVDVV